MTPKAAEIFRVLVPELEKDFLHHQNDERLILNVDTSSQHLSFLPMKTGISQFEATVLEAELIKLFCTYSIYLLFLRKQLCCLDGRLTNVKKESLHVDPVLGDEVRKIYSKNIYDHAIRLSKNEGNLHTFNLWEFISSGRFAPNVFSKTELDTLARQMKENGLFDFASSQNDNGEIHEFLEKISSLLQKKSLKDIIRVLGPELKKMDEIKYHSGAIEKPTENPMFALFKRPLNFATSSHLELFHIPSPSKENFTPPDRNLVQKIILTDYDDCQISEPVFSEFTFFIHKSIDETRRIKGMEKFILRNRFKILNIL